MFGKVCLHGLLDVHGNLTLSPVLLDQPRTKDKKMRMQASLMVRYVVGYREKGREGVKQSISHSMKFEVGKLEQNETERKLNRKSRNGDGTQRQHETPNGLIHQSFTLQYAAHTRLADQANNAIKARQYCR